MRHIPGAYFVNLACSTRGSMPYCQAPAQPVLHASLARCNLLHLSGGSLTHSSNHRQAVCLGYRARQAEGYPRVNTARWVSPLTQSVWFEEYDPARGYIWDCSVSSLVRASKILKQGEPKKRVSESKGYLASQKACAGLLSQTTYPFLGKTKSWQ